MPINKKYPCPTLMDALSAYPLPRRRRITIEYTLVGGPKNDEVEEAKKVARSYFGGFESRSTSSR
jgi:23S rRNA (adenine2503-C2)-methyltransferase